MPDIAWNKSVWNKTYDWPAHGEEWTQQQASFCGVPPEKWKESLARTFLIPYAKSNSTVIEIGPGHGRWTKLIAARVESLWLFDISRSCLDYCRKLLVNQANVIYVLSDDGKFLKGDQEKGGIRVPDASVDFIWSFDTFVHIEEPEVRAYAKEFFRVLKPQGMGVIHHVGTPTPEQRAGGARSLVGARLFGDILRAAGFFVIRQTDEWAGGNLKLTGDVLSVFVRP